MCRITVVGAVCVTVYPVVLSMCMIRILLFLFVFAYRCAMTREVLAVHALLRTKGEYNETVCVDDEDDDENAKKESKKPSNGKDSVRSPTYKKPTPARAASARATSSSSTSADPPCDEIVATADASLHVAARHMVELNLVGYQALLDLGCCSPKMLPLSSGEHNLYV